MSIGTTTASMLAVGKIHIGQSSFSGDFVNTIVTSSSSASLSDTSVATPGYINQYYYDKTTIDSMIGGSGGTKTIYNAFNSWNAKNVKFTASTNYTDFIMNFYLDKDIINSLGGQVGYQIRFEVTLTNSAQKTDALNNLRFRLYLQEDNHRNDFRDFTEPDEVYNQSSSSYYNNKICGKFTGVWLNTSTNWSSNPLLVVQYKNTLTSDINVEQNDSIVSVNMWKL